jgi:predicted PurR-regulated permease PerM
MLVMGEGGMPNEEVIPPPRLDAGGPGAGLPTEGGALTWLALLGLIGILWVALPVAVGVLLGVLMAFLAQPFFERVRRHIRRPGLASFITVALSAVLIVIVIGGLGYLFVAKGVALAEQFAAAFSGPKAAGILSSIGKPLEAIGISHAMLVDRVRAMVESLAAGAAALAERMASATASALLALFLAVLTMQLVLPRWPRFALEAQAVLPIRPEYTRELFVEFRKIGRATLLGTVVTGLAQGALAMIGYFISRVPEPLFFGVATAIASFVPAVGTLLVWVPIGLVLLFTGHVAGGVFELCWGVAVVTGFSDYVLRPRLVGSEQFPTLVTFVALFGGVEVFGLKGLIIGPVLVALGVAILRIYAREATARRAAAGPTRGGSPQRAPTMRP